MEVAAIILVIISGLIHSIWNLFTKRSINKEVFLWYCQFAALIAYMPFVVLELKSIQPVASIGLLLIFLSMLSHGAYVILLARAYSIGDLSQVYPIMRGTSPLLVPVIGVMVLNEQLKIIGWIGISSIVIGIILIGNFKNHKSWRQSNKAIMYAFAVGCMITIYTVVDKVALKYLPAITLNEATNLGNLTALSYFVLKSNGLKQEWRVNWRTILLGGMLAPGGYILFLKALELMPVSQLAPMREIGTVFGTLFGIFLLRESRARSRIIASILITLGIILLAQ